jgi:uncharacterized RDD family membrane protein YckC
VTGNGHQAAVTQPSLEGNYSGAVSRLAAFVLDLLVSYGLFTLALAAVNFTVSILSAHAYHWSRSNSVVVSVVFVVWEFLYFTYCWATTGKTPGMALLGIQVVRADGAHPETWRAVVRTLVLPLSVLFFFVSLPLILVQREHRAPHDLAAGTAVVYAWDARAARWRHLARAGGHQRQVSGAQPSATGEAPAQPSPTGDATPAGQPEGSMGEDK